MLGQNVSASARHAGWLAGLCLLLTPLVALGQVAPPPVVAKTVDLSLIPTTSVLVLVGRPGEVMASKGLEAIASLAIPPQLVAQLEEFEVKVADCESVVFALHEDTVAGPELAPFSLVVTAKKAVAWTKLVGELFPGAHQFTKAGDQGGAAAEGDGTTVAYYVVNDQTLLIERLDKMPAAIKRINSAKKTPAWAKLWESVDLGQVGLYVNLAWARQQIAAASSRGGEPVEPGLAAVQASVSPLVDDLQEFCLGVQVVGKLRVHAVGLARNAEDAVLARDTLRSLIVLSRNMLRGMPGLLRPQEAMAAGGFLRIGDSILKEAKLTTEEKLVRLKIDSQIDVGQALGLVAPLLKQAQTSVRGAAARMQSMNNLKQLSLAMLNYESSNRVFPTSQTSRKKGQPPHSWRVAILPYIEAQNIYDQYHFDEPWDSAHNKQFIQQMPATFRHPSAPANSTSSSYYMFELAKPVTKASEVRDGMSNTILFVEAQRDIPWTKPEDIPYLADGELPRIGGWNPEGTAATFFDGHVMLLKNVDEQVLRALITPAGLEMIDPAVLDE